MGPADESKTNFHPPTIITDYAPKEQYPRRAFSPGRGGGRQVSRGKTTLLVVATSQFVVALYLQADMLLYLARLLHTVIIRISC